MKTESNNICGIQSRVDSPPTSFNETKSYRIEWFVEEWNTWAPMPIFKSMDERYALGAWEMLGMMRLKVDKLRYRLVNHNEVIRETVK